MLSTTDDNGNTVELDGYRWYKGEDATDGTIGWMAGVSLSDGIIYLDYNAGAQTDLERKAQEQPGNQGLRSSAVLDAVSRYHQNLDTSNSLYGTGGGRDNGNDFPKFIQGSSFPKELTLAIAAQESGGFGLDNEICSRAQDGGIGVMQITSQGFKGLGSALDNYPRKGDCDTRTGWIGTTSKYYSNALQGIYANVKDGLRVLQEKYRKKCPKESITIQGIEFTCADIEKVLTVWGYNGLARDENGNFIGNYLRDVAGKLENLGQYFSGLVYGNSDQLINKLKIANNHKKVVKLFSPAELRIVDSENRITGLVDGQVKEDIPNSAYDKDSETAVVFFPEAFERYQVAGKETGTYGLFISSDEDSTSTAFQAIDIPTSPVAVHEYDVNWDALAQGEKGVTVKVDTEGDGTFDYQFQSSNSLHDNVSPETQATTSGTIGINGWYRSDVTIALSANDNDGVGVLKTEYSLDGGLNWTAYAAPFTISQEGVSSILYRSEDFLGNQEVAKTLEIKIDKTPPEAVMYFDTTSRTLKVEGTDTVSVVVVTRDNKNFLVQDDAGNTLKLLFDTLKQDGQQIKAELQSLQYNGSLVRLPRTEIAYEFSWYKKTQKIRELIQKIDVKGEFRIEAQYNGRQNITKLEIEKPKVRKQKIELEGLVIIRLVTHGGALGFLY